MIYLKEFKFWDKIFGESRKSKNEKLAIDIVNYHIDNDLYIDSRNKEYFSIPNRMPNSDVYQAIYRNDGTITLDRKDKPSINIKEVNYNILGLLNSQSNNRKDKEFLYSNLYYMFDIGYGVNEDLTVTSIPEYIWKLMNKYNDDYSFFTYPKTVNKFRFFDMLENEDIFNQDSFSFESRKRRISAIISHYNLR